MDDYRFEFFLLMFLLWTMGMIHVGFNIGMRVARDQQARDRAKGN